MLDPSSPIIPARPAISKRDSQSTTPIPVIPGRPRKQTKSPETSQLDNVWADSKTNILSSDIEKDGEKSTIAEPHLDKNDKFTADSEVSNSADVLLEILSELAEDSPIEEHIQSPSSQESFSKSPTNADSTHVITSSKEASNEALKTKVKTPVSMNSPELDTTDHSANEMKTISTKTSKESAGPEENKNAPHIPTRPRKSDKKDSSILQSDTATSSVDEKLNCLSTKTEPSIVKNTVSSASNLTSGDTSDLNQDGKSSVDIEAGTKPSFEDTANLPNVEIKPEAQKFSGPQTSLGDASEDQKWPLDDKADISDVEHSIQPIVPKRPTRTSTPKIPNRPLNQKSEAVVNEPIEKEDTQPASESPVSSKKAPPPKPKKLSSKIAAFQQMFNQTPLEHTLPKPAPTERGKLSSNQTDFASNLENMMGRGLPLPGMTNPEMIKKLSASEKSNESEPESSAEKTPTASVPRRARGPRGKKLPKLIQETQIEVQPRFQISVADVWEVKFTKPTGKESASAESKKVNDESLSDSYATEELVQAKHAKKNEHETKAELTSKDEPKSAPKSAVDLSLETKGVQPVDLTEDTGKSSEDIAPQVKQTGKLLTVDKSTGKGGLVDHEKNAAKVKETHANESISKETQINKTLPKRSLSTDSDEEKTETISKQHDLGELDDAQNEIPGGSVETKPELKFSFNADILKGTVESPISPQDAKPHEGEP